MSISRVSRWPLCLLLAGWGCAWSGSGHAQEATKSKAFFPVGVEMTWLWSGRLLKFGSANLKGSANAGLSITRSDFLMSGFALKREDGTWLQSSGWNACFKGADGMNRSKLDGVPGQKYRALRFHIGVDPITNKADPNGLAADNPLNPLVNGLHWGWQGGYIFSALEGHFRRADGSDGGFSYHLAGNDQLMTVELPGDIDLSKGGTISLSLDLERIFGTLDPAQLGDSTHSRAGDERAATIRNHFEKAFSLGGISKERWQETTILSSSKSTMKGTRYPLKISSRLPKVALPADNELSIEGVALGDRLFHDRQLSKNETQSCSSCHVRAAGFSDGGKKFSLGAEGKAGIRNAMPLFNLAWQKEFFWDGRSDSLRHQVLEPIKDPVEMHESLENVTSKLSKDPAYSVQFESAFGSREITAERIGLALEQFLLTLVSQDSKFDQAIRGEATFSPSEQRGLQLFITEYDPTRNLRGADCFHCHGGNLFSNQGFANNGLDADPLAARQAVTRQEADKGKFRVPSLRNVAVTGPYMHDGRFATLEEVINHYDHGVHPSPTLDPNLAKHPAEGLGLTDENKADLIAFLRTLTDEKFLNPTTATTALSKE